MTMPLLKIFAAGVALTAICTATSAIAQDTNQGTFGIERGTGKIICTGDGDGSGEGQAPLDESYARSAAWDARVLGVENVCQASNDPVFETVDAGAWERTEMFSGTDAEGRRADMRIYVLDQRFTWQFGSSRNIEENGAPASFNFIFGRPNFLGEFCAGDAAVAIGAASFEGEAELNRRLAGNRAQTIAGEMKRLTDFCTPQTPPQLHKINLGEFTAVTDCMRAGTCTQGATSPQRRVVLLAVAEAETGVNLSEAVRNGLASRTALSVLSVDDYGLYTFSDF